jgi:tetratricopeptide (TPR) repeat protein
MTLHDHSRYVRLRIERRFLAGVAALSLIVTGCGQETSAPAAAVPAPLPPPKVSLGRVACITTQWYPQGADANDETENSLIREIARQGVLMALREEMGLVTRDETLGEPFPAAAGADADSPREAAKDPAEPLAVAFDLDKSGEWTAKLSGAGAAPHNPVWKHAGKVEFDKRSIYAQLATQMADASATIGESLRAAGAEGTPAKLNPENTPPAEIEQLLAEMNFVSQYAAVRASHHAMAENGTSPAWLGVLVRGYANLALLTEHTWSSQQDAFAARSLLYAERMMQLDDDSELAQWHRAYARAIVGAHGSALDQLQSLNKNPSAENKSEPDGQPPAWTELIAPYVEFKPDALTEIADKHPELEETAALLRWHVYRSYMHGRWIHEKGLEAMEACPEAYPIYSVLANWQALMVKRIGASAGISTFGDRLPARVAKLPNLPKATRAFTADQSSLLSRMLGTRQQAALSDRPVKIARSLLTATREEADPTECSWAILAGLIAEEQFVEAANLLNVSKAGVERSSEALVAQLTPLVEDHRYAPYVRSIAASPSEAQRAAKILREMTVVDPRPTMKPLFIKAWRSPMANGKTGNELAWRTLWGFNHTQSGLLQTCYGMASDWTGAITATRQKYAREFQQVSPHSPNAIRLQWETAETVEPAQLAKWETELGDDPVGWLTVANEYYELNDLDAATRCYQRSLEISPSYDATVGLANSYYHNDKKELWQSTLETYLEVEDLSLSHANIHRLIANERISSRAWSEAEPHALAAAQTYSAWGLELASHVYEGQQEWEPSEEYIAEASRNYPSSMTGTDWYFWCRRTGRGEIKDARKVAEGSVAIAATRTYLSDAHRTFVFRLLEGDSAAAVAGLEEQITRCPDQEPIWDKTWRLLHAVDVAGEAKNDALKKQALDQLRALAANEIKTADPDWVAVIEGLCRAFEGEQLNEEFLKSYDATISSGSSDGRCNYQYFMGAALDQQGLQEKADAYLRLAAFGGPFSNYNATLAGHRMAERHGPERGGMPEDLAKQDAEAEAKAKEDEGNKDESDKQGENVGASDRSI